MKWTHVCASHQQTLDRVTKQHELDSIVIETISGGLSFERWSPVKYVLASASFSSDVGSKARTCFRVKIEYGSRTGLS